MKRVTVILDVPEDDCTHCHFVEEIDDREEIGIFTSHWCNLFDENLEHSFNPRLPKPCAECKVMQKKGSVNISESGG